MDTHEPSLRELATRIESAKSLLTEKVDALKELQDQKWKAHDEVHRMGQKALDSSVEANNVRLEGMNLFRNQVLEERADFLKVAVYEVEHKALEAKMEARFEKVNVEAVAIHRAFDARVRDLERYKWVATGVVLAITIAINLLFKFWGK